MIDTLNIGAYIYSVLSEDTELSSMVTKIVPCIAGNDTKFPFIVWHRTGLTSNCCKDGYYEDQVQIRLDIVASTYTSSIDIANKVRSIIEKAHTKHDTMQIEDVTIETAYEEWSNDAFIQTIIFNFKVN